MDSILIFAIFSSGLQEKDETRAIPVIILTAKGQMRDLFALGSNVAAFMEKPFDPKGLRDKVREILMNA